MSEHSKTPQPVYSVDSVIAQNAAPRPWKRTRRWAGMETSLDDAKGEPVFRFPRATEDEPGPDGYLDVIRNEASEAVMLAAVNSHDQLVRDKAAAVEMLRKVVGPDWAGLHCRSNTWSRCIYCGSVFDSNDEPRHKPGCQITEARTLLTKLEPTHGRPDPLDSDRQDPAGDSEVAAAPAGPLARGEQRGDVPAGPDRAGG